MSLFTTYIALGIAIALEVVGTSALQASQQFTRTVPTIVMAVSYLSAFYFLSPALRTIPVGIAYAIWSGLGIVLISIVGLVVFKQKLDLPAVLGLAMIVGGVVVVNVFSKAVTH
ncbi:QacE family quaternary ammonium compound efflux SMR transporter [Brucella pseudogrignonensis]|nr:QacE family quaternary ammonium compound efflux SMR transporter [Brucella pseudogrignonensis]